MVRFGIMGAGNISHKFCDAVSLTYGAEVAAVASKSEDRAKKFAASHEIKDFYGNYEDMLKREDIDIIYIGTTVNFHYDNIKECFKWNKHVMCEKSMVRTYAEAAEIFSSAKQKNLFIMECMWTNFLPKTKKVKEWIKEGKIGNIKLAQANIGFLAPKDVNGRLYNKELGGGVLYDIGVYPIEMLGFIFEKEITKVESRVSYAKTGVDETVNLNLEYDDIYANIQCSISAKMPEDIYIYGDKGYIIMKKLHFGNTARLYDINDKLEEEFVMEEGNGFVYQVKAAISCIENGKLESDIAPHKMTLECARVFDHCLNNL